MPEAVAALTVRRPEDLGEPSAAETHRCLHCGLPMEESEPPFCCHGCELAASIIREAGLERYYVERTRFPPRPTGLEGSWEGVPARNLEDGSREARLAVDGLRCASCVWVAERAVGALPGVTSAHVSYGSGRATVRWDPATVTLGEIAARVAGLGYRPRVLGEEGRPDRSLMVRLGVAAFGALNIMMIHAALYAGWADMDPRFSELFRWTALALASPLALWCAEPFFRGAWEGLRQRRLHMDLPIAISVLGLYTHGVWATLAGPETYLDSMGMLVALLLGGRMLEGRGRRRAAEAAVTLGASVPPRARRRAAERVEDVPVDALHLGDDVEIAAGEEVPVDGTVTQGGALVDVSMVTGESVPAKVEVGSEVVAGTLLIEGAVSVRVAAAGQDTVVARMAEEVRAAVDRPVTRDRLERVAPWFTAATLLVGLATLLAWWWLRGWDAALPVTVSVLVVACPCALALARPLTLASGLGAAARRGLLLRSGDALLDLARVDLAVMDKTGTVTQGQRRVVSGEDSVVRVASALARWSAHPVARSVVDEAVRRGIPLPGSVGVKEVQGTGLEGEVDGVDWRLRGDGRGGVTLQRLDGMEVVPVGTIELDDCVRTTSYEVVSRLARMDVGAVLLSGDAKTPVESVGQALGIAQRIWGATPSEKADYVRDARARGHRVLFVGDGLNDGPALAEADVGLSMRRGAASSLLVADGVLIHDSAQAVPDAIEIGRLCSRIVGVAQRRSIAYNVLAVAAAAAGWVNPLVAAILMPASSALVISSASGVERRLGASP